MFVKVFPDNHVALDDVHDFRAFKVVIEGSLTKLEDARLALLDLAELPDCDTAWVSKAALRRRPEVAQDCAWQEALTVMIEKAKAHGWVDEARSVIKAHIQWAIAK